MLLCQITFVAVNDESSEEEEVLDDTLKDILEDTLSTYGLVQSIVFVRKSRFKSVGLEITMQKPSESARAAEALNGSSLPISASTSSLIRAQFLGMKTTRIKVHTAKDMPISMKLIQRRFACCGTITQCQELVANFEFLISFDSVHSAHRAVEDFDARNGLPEGCTVELWKMDDVVVDDKKKNETNSSKRSKSHGAEETIEENKSGCGEVPPTVETTTPPSIVVASKPVIAVKEEDEEEEIVSSQHQLFIVHSKQVSVEELYALFHPFPGCIQVEIMRTKKKHDSVRGTSFITFDSPQAAQLAVEAWNGLEFPSDSKQYIKAMFARGQRREDPSAADTLIEPFMALSPLVEQQQQQPPPVQLPPSQWAMNSPPAPPPSLPPPSLWPSDVYYLPPPPEVYFGASPSIMWPPPQHQEMMYHPNYYSAAVASPMIPQTQSRVMFYNSSPHSPSSGEMHQENSRLYVSYVRNTGAVDLGETEIQRFFHAAAPELLHVYKLKDRPLFFVKYRTALSAMQAMMRLNGFTLYGCVLRVVWADPSPRERGQQHQQQQRSTVNEGGGSKGEGGESKRQRDEKGE